MVAGAAHRVWHRHSDSIVHALTLEVNGRNLAREDSSPMIRADQSLQQLSERFLIGIDASRSVSAQPTGTELYSRYLIEALLDRAPDRFSLSSVLQPTTAIQNPTIHKSQKSQSHSLSAPLDSPSSLHRDDPASSRSALRPGARPADRSSAPQRGDRARSRLSAIFPKRIRPGSAGISIDRRAGTHAPRRTCWRIPRRRSAISSTSITPIPI